MTPMTPDYTGSGNSLFGSYRAAPLNVHVNHAGVGALAGQGVTPGVTPQTAANTVVIGQKVDAVFKYDPMLALDTGTLRWSEPTGGGFVRSYTTNDLIGWVVPLTLQHRTGAALDFYYTGKSANTGSVICSVNGSNGIWLTNPNEYVHYITASASFYLVAPTDVLFTCEWANWGVIPGTNVPRDFPVGVRPFKAGGIDNLMLGGTPPGLSQSPGITWTANVGAPPVIGGGVIAFNNQICSNGKLFNNNVQTDKLKANGLPPMLDRYFPYSGSSEYIKPVGTTLVCNDSPGQPLQNNVGYDKIVLEDKFNTYLIYKPKGTATIWVTLSVIGWQWGGTATYNASSDKWTLSSPMVGGAGVGPTTIGTGYGTPTSDLPVWDENFRHNDEWIPV